MSDLQTAFDFLRKCISLEKDSVWDSTKSDPISLILSDLESVKDGIFSCCEPCCRDAQPSTSQDTAAVFFDARIRYGHIVMSVLKKVAQELSILKDQEGSSIASLVSVKHMALLSSAFQFFILTCISPYLDKGVGVPLQLRSQVIRSWDRLACDTGFRISQLSRAGQCIIALLSCNSDVRSELLNKYCSDIICVFEQLKSVGLHDMSSQYEELLAVIPRRLLVCSLLGLVKPRTTAAPTWFTDSIGSRLSALLLGEDGLHITLSAYEEISDGQFWNNTPLLSVLGKQFSLPPRNIKKMAYYKNITDQFLALISSGKFSREKVALLFSLFVVQLKKRSVLAWGTMVEDVLYKSWEIIANSSKCMWCSSHATSLCLLRIWSENQLSSHLLKDSPRFLPVATVLLSLLPVSASDVCSSRNLHDDIIAVVKFALGQVENLSDFLLTFITDSTPCFQLSPEKKLVQMVDEHLPLYGAVILSNVDQNKDELLARKIDGTITVLKEFGSVIASRLFVEIACKSVQKWDDAETCDLPRFLDHCDSEVTDIVSRRSVSHFVAGVFFEQLQNCEIDSSNAEITHCLVNLIQAVLNSTIRHLNERHERTSLDVVVEESEHDRQLHSVVSKNAGMAIGLAGAVVMAAVLDERIISVLSQLCSILSSFVAHISSLRCNEETFVAMAEDARKLLCVFGENLPIHSPVSRPIKKENSTDIVGSIRNGLLDDSPVTRGGALLETGRLIRARHAVILTELDKWLFKTMKDLIVDPDSYVYLAAINSLAEAACYGSKYLRELIALFKNFSGSEAVDTKVSSVESDVGARTVDANVVVRSRLCEVIGKVFHVLGDMSPVWMDESAGVFLSCLTDKDEIIRASALSSLAELILSCHGRNVEKYLDEILYAVERLLSSDTSALVRRAAVNLLRQIIKSCDTDLFEVIGGRLRDLQRELLRLWRWDPDHVVRLHAELALDEMRAAVKAVITLETTSRNRVIL